MDDALDETLTACQNAERRTLWTRQQVIDMLRLQRRDDAAAIRAEAALPGNGFETRLIYDQAAAVIYPDQPKEQE